MYRNSVGTIWVHQKCNYINNTQNRIKMIWFCNVITTDLCEKSNPKKSSNNKQSFINGVNKPFMGLFLLSWYLYDTCFDSTTDIIVWEIIKRICYDNNISLDFTHNIICMSMHTNIFNVTSDATIRFKADLFLYDL